MILKKIMTTAYFSLLSCLFALSVKASHMELVAPIKEKGDQVMEMIVFVFGIISGIVLIVQVARGCMTKDPGVRHSSFLSVAWITAGCILIYNFAKFTGFIGLQN